MPITLNGSTGIILSTWTTAGRPSSPTQDQMGFNTTTLALDVYNGTSWTSIPMPTSQGTSGQYLQSAGAGAAPTWATLSATGSLIRAPQLLTSGTSYTTPSNCTAIYFELWGAGGSGGRGGSVGGGGGSGAYCAKYATVTGNTAYTIAVGSGGAAPTSNNGNGNTGGTTSITIGATTYSATGGTGGSGNPVGGTNSASGGNGGTATNGDINISGQYGATGMGSAASNMPQPTPWGQFNGSYSTGFNGNGGCTVGSLACPSGGAGGSPGTPTFYGAGSGGVSSSTSASAGFQGLIRIWEYT